jgi:hypothetical protein
MLEWRFVIELPRPLSHHSAKIPYHSRKPIFHGWGASSRLAGIRNSAPGGLDTIQGPTPGNTVRVHWLNNMRIKRPAAATIERRLVIRAWNMKGMFVLNPA